MSKRCEPEMAIMRLGMLERVLFTARATGTAYGSILSNRSGAIYRRLTFSANKLKSELFEGYGALGDHIGTWRSRRQQSCSPRKSEIMGSGAKLERQIKLVRQVL